MRASGLGCGSGFGCREWFVVFQRQTIIERLTLTIVETLQKTRHSLCLVWYQLVDRRRRSNHR